MLATVMRHLIILQDIPILECKDWLYHLKLRGVRSFIHDLQPLNLLKIHNWHGIHRVKRQHVGVPLHVMIVYEVSFCVCATVCLAVETLIVEG